jgi:hypothetical protein
LTFLNPNFFYNLYVFFSQPVFLKFRIKSNQGIVTFCDHVLAVQEDSNKENLVIENGLKHPKCCVVCLKHLNAITEKFSDSLSASALLPLKLQVALENHQSVSPSVSISVVDADNLNVCMCNLMEDQNNHETIEGDKICKICRNIIKKQPAERCTLVSKRTMLGDVVVNRIDSQYLTSTYSTPSSQLRKLRDPYTPESVESHSPQPEIDEKEFPIINETLDSEDILDNIRELNKHKTCENEMSNGEMKENHENDKVGNFQSHYNMVHTISPSQLTSRLENLRRESQLIIHDGSSKSGSGSGADVDDKKSLNKSKCCLSCSCVIS